MSNNSVPAKPPRGFSWYLGDQWRKVKFCTMGAYLWEKQGKAKAGMACCVRGKGFIYPPYHPYSPDFAQLLTLFGLGKNKLGKRKEKRIKIRKIKGEIKKKNQK